MDTGMDREIAGLSVALSPKQAAERMNVSESMIWKLVQRRHIGSFHVGKRARRIPLAELDRYAAQHFTAPRERIARVS